MSYNLEPFVIPYASTIFSGVESVEASSTIITSIIPHKRLILYTLNTTPMYQFVLYAGVQRNLRHATPYK